MLGKDPATLTKDERNIAKMVNFGIIYGISSFGLSENLEIPRDEAQAYIDAYLARFPHVQDFIQRTIEQAARDGYVTTLLRPPPPGAGDPRVEPADARRSASGSPSTRSCRAPRPTSSRRRWSRSTSACATRAAAARLVLQVHDELLLEAPEAEVSAVKQLVREEMCRAFHLDPPLEVDVGAGDDWNEAK